MLNLNKDKRYLLACSYGPDSMFLFQKLLDEGFSFDVAHVNYHLREESDNEERSLSLFCKEHNIKLFIKNNNEKIDKNVEAKCREIRYSFFKELCDSNSYDAVLVAHNQDDLIETYLLQKKRKNLVIYYGIKENCQIKGVNVIRPILKYPKREIISYCDSHGVPYTIDKTNLLPIYERNVIRLDVVSKLNKEERKEILDIIEQENTSLHKTLIKVSNIDNSIDSLKELSDTEFAYYINLKAKQIDESNQITYKTCKQIKESLTVSYNKVFLESSKKNLFIEKCYGKLYIVPKVNKHGYRLVIEKPLEIDNEFLYANLKGDTSNRNIQNSDYPLTIRTAEKNDIYQIKNYFSKVRRLYIDWKMPKYLRYRWPVIVNKEGKIIYIPRYQKDFKPDKSSNFYVKECFTLK